MVATRSHPIEIDLLAPAKSQETGTTEITVANQRIIKPGSSLSLTSLSRDRAYLPIVGWDEIVNIGDQIILDVTDHVFNYRPMRVSHDIDHMLGIGSLFFMANTKSRIWGTGILTSDEPIPEITPSSVYALRGERTADRLTREGYRLPVIPLGDPGIFVSEYASLDKADHVSAKKIVIIPHHSTYSRWINGQFARSNEIEVIDPCTSKADFLKKIFQANTIISESLHGLVFAIAFKKEVVWIGDADADLFKYHDWFSMVECPPLKPLDPNSSINDLIRAAQIYNHNIKVDDLRQSFPHGLAVQLSDRRIDYKAARDQHPFCFFFQDHQWPLVGNGLSATLCFDIAASVANTIFDCWDDRPYALGIAHRSGILPNKQQLDQMIYEMNHHLYNDFAVIVTKQQVIQAGLQMHPLSHGLFWAFGKLTGISTVLIRPSGKRRGDHHVIFCM